MSNTKTPVTFTPTWNGMELGNNWVVANGLKASRPMTPEEQDVITNAYIHSLEKAGRKVTVTKNGDKTTITAKW
jgi:hypothetical protein